MNNKFTLIAPMYNAAKTLPKLLHSLYAQSYHNWELVLIDDMSEKQQLDECKDILKKFESLHPVDCDWNIPVKNISGYGPVVLIENSEKKWEVANVLEGIKLASDSDIIGRIDPDDYLSDNDSLRIINEVYNQTSCEALWTNHRWFDDKSITNYNISGPMSYNVDPYKHPWVTSHFKTFKKYLLNNIKDENFRGKDNEYIKRAGDQAIYLPVLHQTNKRVHLPICMYSYRCDLSPQTFQTEDAKFQLQESEFLRARGFIS